MADIILSRLSGSVRPITERYKDMSDGTFARVIYVVSEAGGDTDALMSTDEGRAIPKRFKDMGDGTHAEVAFVA